MKQDDHAAQDTSDELYEKLHSSRGRYEWIMNVMVVGSITVAALTVSIALLIYYANIQRKCSAAGGVYIHGTCLAVKEIKP
jgi:hypothetical protein